VLYVLAFVFQIYYIFTNYFPDFFVVNIMQDITNSGIWYLCKFIEDINNGPNGGLYKVRCLIFACIVLHLSSSCV